MILKRLLSARWRKQPTDAPNARNTAEWERLASDTDDPGKRRQACKNTRDPAMLRRMATEDADAGVREYAAARLRKLLCGELADGPDLKTRIAVLLEAQDPALAAQTALHGKETELRLAAVAAVQDQAALTECALNDAVSAVRLAAVEGLQDKTSLERVARQIGRKDKNVYRMAKQKLKAIAEQEREPARIRAEAEALCEHMEKLGRHGAWSQDKALLDMLEQQWAELGGDIPAAAAERFETARRIFMEAYAVYREENRARLEAEEALENLRAAKQGLLEQLSPLSADQPDCESRLETVSEQWRQLDSLPAELEKPLRRRFDQILDDLEQQLARRHERQRRGEKLDQLARQAEQLLAQSKPLDHKVLARWQSAGEKLVAMQAEDTAAKRHAECLMKLQTRMDKQRVHAEQKLAALPERLAQLEQALDNGVLREATGLHQSIHADLELVQLSHTGHKRNADEANQRLRQLTPRLRELQNWRKWGTDQHRDDLCAAMEALTTVPMEAAELAEQIQTLQREWKSLDRNGSPVNEALWQRFHTAADQAFERCRPYFEEQAAIRETHRQEREKLCAELENFLDQVDWARMDWKKAVHAEREMRTAWANMGPVEPKQRRKLEKRFHASLKRLDTHLAEERSRNRSMKKELITQATALHHEPDLERAIDEIKALQHRWKTTVPSKRKLENQLWQSFRAACDAVFERRQAKQKAQRDQLAGHATALAELCAEAESLAASVTNELDQPLQALRKRWREGRELPLARQDAARLEKRWQAAMDAVNASIVENQRLAEREQLERLRNLAALCNELERALQQDPADLSTTAWEQRWETLAPPETEVDRQAIRRRFENALAASQDPAQRTRWLDGLAANAKARAFLCLHLEVLTGSESPPEATEERLAFQVNRLSDRLGHGERDPLDDPEKVERAWYLSAPAPAAEAEALERRFEQARRAAMKGASAPATV